MERAVGLSNLPANVSLQENLEEGTGYIQYKVYLGRLKRRRFVKLSSLFKRFEIEVSSSVQAVKTM